MPDSFKNGGAIQTLECQHWAPKFDIWALKMILLFLLRFSIVSSASLVVLVWELDCRRLRSFLIPKRSLFIGFFLLLDGSRVIDDCQRWHSSLASG